MPASLDMTTGVDACVHTCGGTELWPNGSMGLNFSGNLFPGCCAPGVAAAPAAGCDSSASSGLPAAHCLHTDVASANEYCATDWSSYNNSWGYFAPWMEADKFSLLALPTQAHIKVSAAAENAFSCGLTEPSRGWNQQPCSAGYFSAWLRGECLSVNIPEADSQAAPAKSPASQAFTAPSSQPARLAASEPGAEAHESMRRTAPTLHITIGGPLEDSDSLSSPLGSDCRAPQYACSGYESGRSSSMSLLSWDGRSSGSSGGEHEQDTCWAPTDAVLRNGRLQACGEQPRGGGGTPEANDCTELVIVDCDVWEREVEAKLSAEANYTISSPPALAPVHPADAAIEAEAYLAHMLWTVVTEALFDPCPDTYTTC